MTSGEWPGTIVQAAGGIVGPATLTTRIVFWVGGHVLAAARGLVGNFEGLVPGAGLTLLALTVAGLIASSVRPDRAAAALRALDDHVWPTVLSITLLTWAAVANEAVIGRVLHSRVRLGLFSITSIRILQTLTALGGIALLARRPIGRVLGKLAAQINPASCAPRVLAVALVVPWMILVLLVEPGREDRLVGLWPLQVIVLSFVALALPAAVTRHARPNTWLCASLVAILVVFNPFVVSTLEAWRQEGWSGPDAVEVRIADFLARRLKAEGRTNAAIGYRLFQDGPPAPPWQEG